MATRRSTMAKIAAINAANRRLSSAMNITLAMQASTLHRMNQNKPLRRESTIPATKAEVYEMLDAKRAAQLKKQEEAANKKKKKKKKKKDSAPTLEPKFQRRILNRLHNLRLKHVNERAQELGVTKSSKLWTPKEIEEHVLQHGVSLKDDALNYIAKGDTVNAGTSKAGCIFRQNPSVILVFKKIKRTPGIGTNRNVTREEVQKDVDLMKTVIAAGLKQVPEVYTDTFDVVIDGVETYGFLMRRATSLMVEPYKPQAHKQTFKYIKGRLKLLTLSQLLVALHDVQAISEFTREKMFIHDLQIFLQDIGPDTGRVFVFDPGEAQADRKRDQTKQLRNAIGTQIKNRLAGFATDLLDVAHEDVDKKGPAPLDTNITAPPGVSSPRTSVPSPPHHEPVGSPTMAKVPSTEPLQLSIRPPSTRSLENLPVPPQPLSHTTPAIVPRDPAPAPAPAPAPVPEPEEEPVPELKMYTRRATARPEAAEAAPAAPTMKAYLIFDTASGGVFFNHFSLTPVKGMIGVADLKKKVPKFKLTRNGGRSEIIRNMQTDKKKYYKGIAMWVKSLKSYDPTLAIFNNETTPTPVQWLLHTKANNKVVTVASGEVVGDLGKYDKVGVVHADSGMFAGCKKLNKRLFTSHTDGGCCDL